MIYKVLGSRSEIYIFFNLTIDMETLLLQKLLSIKNKVIVKVTGL